jgi:hypothetical protein
MAKPKTPVPTLTILNKPCRYIKRDYRWEWKAGLVLVDITEGVPGLGGLADYRLDVAINGDPIAQDYFLTSEKAAAAADRLLRRIRTSLDVALIG